MDSSLLEAHKKIVSSEIKQRNKEKKPKPSNTSGNASNSDVCQSMEDKETDDFLDKTFKKSVSDGFRQRNREKKLLRESATQDLSGVSNETTSSVIKDEKSQSHKKREAENIVQDVFDFTATSAPEKTHMTEITMTGNPLPVTENTDGKNSVVILSVAKSKPLLNLACLYQKACDAEKQRIRANQDEILCWYHYIIEFDNQVKNIMKTNRIGEKKAKGQIYDFIIAQLGTKRNTLLKQTQRARNIYKLFEKIGIDKIKYITTYSANSISELSDSQIQTIVDYFSKNPNTELPDDRDGTIIDFEEDISNDQDNVLEEQAKPLVSAMRAEVSIPTAPIPLTHVSNSSGDSSSSKKLDTKVEVVPPIPQPNNPTHVQARNKVLKLYPDISFHSKPSDESEDVYRCRTKSSICPSCKTNHKENIVGRYWEGSYLLSCMYKMKGLEVVV
ncbi:unnamed protein product [Rhizophagus irregularis]|nr:unnamed protein product [Rhizophagus irregularis]